MFILTESISKNQLPNMINHLKVIVIFSILLLSASCSDQIWSDYDTGVDRKEFETYMMYVHDTEYELGVNPINKIRIENAVKANLRDLGLKTSENPDLLVKYFVKLDQKEFIETCNNTYNEFSGGEYCIERVVTYEEGTLVIDIIDASEDKIVWHGVVQGAPIDRSRNPDKKIKTVIRKLMKEFKTYRKEYLG